MPPIIAPPISYHLTEADRSHDDIRRLLHGALNPNPGSEIGNDHRWPREIYDDYLIYEQGSKTFRQSYTIDEDDSVTLGDAKPVREVTTYEPVTESISPSGGSLIEALDEAGWNWRVQLIKAGQSANGNVYPLPVLHEAAPTYNGVPAYYGKGKDHNPNERGFDSVAGWITETAPNTHGIEGTLEISRGKPEVRDAIRHAWDVKQRTGRETFGFSHVIPAGGFKARRRQPKGWTIEAIHKAESVDIVMTPAAGGSLLAPLSESVTPDTLKEAIVDTEKLLGKLRAGEKLPDGEMQALVEAVGWEEVTSTLTEGLNKADAEKATSKLAETVQKNHNRESSHDDKSGISEAWDAKLAEIERKSNERVALFESKLVLTEALEESHLPERMKVAIREDFADRVFEADELEARIKRDTEIHESLLPAGRRPTPGGAKVTEDQSEKWQKAMDGLIFGEAQDGVTPFRTLKEAYLAISGKAYSYIDSQLPYAVLGEAVNWDGDSGQLEESITSSTFGEVLGDSITRRMLVEFQMPDRNIWRNIVTRVPVTDFRIQRRTRWGGYGLLDLVGEGATYQALSSPGDEEATDKLDKYGGLESLTIETIANDDVGLVRRIPMKLGQGAIDTIYDDVFNNTIVANAQASYDTTALYDASHNNTDVLALDESGLTDSENAMRDQTEFGNQSGLVLGSANMPRFLLIPNELRTAAFKLTQSDAAVTSAEDATTPNMFRGRYTVLVVDDWTDANDWYLFADPNRSPVFEMGFWNGRETPELFVQDAQTVGSVFTADRITYKIRIVYYIMIVDHRGTFRNVVA